MDAAVSHRPNARKSERPMQRAPSADSSGDRTRDQEVSREYAPEAAGTPPPQGWTYRGIDRGQAALGIRAAPLPSRGLQEKRIWTHQTGRRCRAAHIKAIKYTRAIQAPEHQVALCPTLLGGTGARRLTQGTVPKAR